MNMQEIFNWIDLIETIDINSKPWDKIICIDRDNWGRWSSNPKELETGKEYTIKSIEIHNWCTDVYLEEIEWKCNSCAFINKK